MLVVRGPTCLRVMSFVGLSFVAPLLLVLTLRTFAALRTIVDPNRDVSRFRRELRNRWGVIGVSRVLWFSVYCVFLFGAPQFNHQFSSLGSTVPSSNASIHLPLLLNPSASAHNLAKQGSQTP